MRYSTNYNFQKPEITDTVNVNVLNQNTDLLDTILISKVDSTDFNSHKNDINIHVTTLDKTNWNNKWDYNELQIKSIKVNNAGNSDTVNGKTVETSVPLNAKFTDTHVELSDSVISISSATGASSKAAKTAYDKGVEALNTANSIVIPTSLPADGGNANTVNNKTVESNVPLNAKFTDTVTTINGKTGTILKADITALGIPSADTHVELSDSIISISTTTGASSLAAKTAYDKGVEALSAANSIVIPTSLPANGGDSDTVNGKTVETSVPLGAKFTDTIYNDTTVKSDINSNATEIANIKTALDEDLDGSILDTITNIKSQWQTADQSLQTLINNKVEISDFNTHKNDTTAHVTALERTGWDSKWDYDELQIKSVKVNNAMNADTVNGKTVQTNVPLNAKFTDTITTINGNTGTITKDDIVALGIPSADTHVSLSSGVTSTSTIVAANSRAVKTAYDKGVEALNAANTKETAFSKNTAFNKNFGTSAGTVAEGNHNHDSKYYTESEVDTKLNTKVDKVGGTITGDVTISKTNGRLIFDETAYTTGNSGLQFKTSVGQNCTILHEVNDSDLPQPGQGLIIAGSLEHPTHLKIDGEFYSNANKVWHAGNFNPSAKANSSHTHTKSQITDFPVLSTVATSGNYNDLSNKPTSLPANGGNANTVNNKTVESNVPLNAKFTDTVTTINGNTGTITKADIVALGVPSSDTHVTLSSSVASISTTVAATSQAVKTAYDKGVEALNAANAKETAFSKNTAFNKNFGTGAGTVAEGNHNHDDRYYTESEINSLLSDRPIIKSGSGNFLGSGNEVIIAHGLGSIPSSAYVTPTQNPGGYLGETWVRFDVTNIYIGNSGTFIGTFCWTAIK